MFILPVFVTHQFNLDNLLAVLLSVGCTGINSSSREDTANSQTSTPSAVTIANTDRSNKLRDRIAQISHAAKGSLGMTATVLETGESVSLNGERRFPMQSVYQFLIAMAVLAQVDKENLKLDQKIRVEVRDIVRNSQILKKNSQGKEYRLAELIKYMVSESDSTACDVLLRLIGKPQRVTICHKLRL